MSEPTKPDVPVGRKLPEHALWNVLQNRAQPLALEFCSWFFGPNAPSYAKARKWLEEYGIKISINALQGFYNSLDIRLKFASLQAESLSDSGAKALPANLEEATRQRIAQTMFELAYTPLGENQRLQLIALQQSADGMKGNFQIKKAKLELDRQKLMIASDAYLDRLLKRASELVSDGKLSQSQRIAAMREEFFKDVDELEKSGEVQLPK